VLRVNFTRNIEAILWQKRGRIARVLVQSQLSTFAKNTSEDLTFFAKRGLTAIVWAQPSTCNFLNPSGKF
jgi:hypothetical protein